MLSRSKTLRVALFAVPMLAVAAAAIVLTFGLGSGEKAQADFPHSGVDLSIGAPALSCDSGGTSTCTADAGATVNVALNLNSIGTLPSYDGYDSIITYTNISVVGTSLVATGAGNWPGCVFSASNFDTPGTMAAGCGIGIGAASSTYTGAMYHIDFTCPSPAPASPAVLTLVHGPGGNTALTDSKFMAHGETVNETLTITCGASGGGDPTDTPVAPTDTPVGPTNTPVGPTNTPVGPTNTPVGPTNTPVPPTNTPTRTNTPMPSDDLGDVNGDGIIDVEDALWILWAEAGIVDDVPLPENADVNDDGVIDSIDALFVLWIVGGEI
jgi:hypothetical protein